jgi:hypothetical protein
MLGSSIIWPSAVALTARTDPALCRNIVLDSRYMLFVIEKISGARHLIEELQIVR